MSPGEARAKHTATQFRDWLNYFDQELNDLKRQDYQSARVAYEVYELRATLSTIFGGKLPHQTLEEFVIKFERGTVKTIDDMDDEEREAEIKRISQNSQAIWLGAMGLDHEGRPVVPVTPAPLPQESHLPAQESPLAAKSNVQEAKSPTTGKIRRVIKPGGSA